MAGFRRDVAAFWRSWVVVLTPLLLLPLPLLENSRQTWCGYTVLIMSVYWVTEALPLPVTALLPTLMFPLLGVLDTASVTAKYMTSTGLLFVTSLMVALAVERSGLHVRAALKTLLLVGSGVSRLMLGLMAMTMVFSMWMANTAVAAMVVPIVETVVTSLTETEEEVEDDHLEDVKDAKSSETPDETPIEACTSTTELSVEKNHDPPLTAEQLRPPLFICVAYAANCGGMGTLIGTPPNIVLQAIVEQYYGLDTGLNFGTYMLLGVPTALLCGLFGWLLLVVMFLGPRHLLGHKTDPARIAAVKRSLQRRYNDLGPMPFQEWAVFLLIVLLALLFFFREPGFMPGWGALFAEGSVADCTAGMLIVILMFMIPSQPRFWCLVRPGQTAEPSPSLLVWKDVETNLPWGIVLLVGGGLAIAEGAEQSGLADWLGDKLTVLDTLSPALVAFCVCAFTTLLTEVASNTAMATILLPVMAQLSKSMLLNPLYLMLPAAISCSFAFMLPVATPPNAIVYNAGGLRLLDMLKAGALMNVLCVGVNMLMLNTLADVIFQLDEYPSWANTTQ